jgi:hypothetical protein
MVDEVTVSWSLWQAEPNERVEITRSLYVQLTTQRRSHAGAVPAFADHLYLQILVDEAAEPVSSVRAVGVEVLEVCSQNDVEVAWSSDQEVIEDFAQGRDPSRSTYVLHDRSATPADSSWYSSCWTTVR